MRPEKEKTTTLSPLAGIPLISTAAAALQPEIPNKASASNITCGRFQFKCHSGECIAVYNACDGIPQCEDGSDEGPECSAASLLSGSQPVAKFSLTNDASHASNAEVPKQQLLLEQSVPQFNSQQQLQQQQQQQQQHNIITPPVINNREDSQAWANRKIVDAQQNEADRNSRIFNHKGGIQVPTNGIIPFPNANIGQVYAPIPRGIFLPQPEGSSAFRSQQMLQPQIPHIIVPSNVNWPQTQNNQQVPVHGATYIINGPQPQLIQPLQPKPVSTLGNEFTNRATGQENKNIEEELPKPKSHLSSSITITENKMKPPETPAISKFNTGSDEEYVDYTEKSTEPPKKKQRKHKKSKAKSVDKTGDKQSAPENLEYKTFEVKAPLHEQHKRIHASLETEYVDHDGLSERPRGAVLSLTLGLLVTAALALLISCRMRTIGRRARRLGGKTAYSHDADFLVNGMYL